MPTPERAPTPRAAVVDGTVPAGPAVTADPVVTARHGTALVASSAAYLAALGLMGLVFTSSPPPQLDGHLDVLLDGFVRYQWGFVGAALLAPTLVAVLLLLLHVAGVPSSGVRRSVEIGRAHV